MGTSSGYVIDCVKCGKPFMKRSNKSKPVCMECRNPTGRTNAYGTNAFRDEGHKGDTLAGGVKQRSPLENKLIALEDRMAKVEHQLLNITHVIDTAVDAAMLNIEEDAKRISERIVESAEREVVSLMKERVDKHVLALRSHLNERIATLEEFVGFEN